MIRNEKFPLNIQMFVEETENDVEQTTVDDNVIVGEEENGETDESVQEIETVDANEEIELTDNSMNSQVQGKMYTQEEHQAELNRLVDKIVARERRNAEKRYKPLVNTLQAGGFESDDPAEIANTLRENYENQGIEVPKYYSRLSEREERALAKVDADEVIELGDEVMKQRFMELYNKSDRSIREEEEMYLIGKENSMRIAKKDLLEMGADPETILHNEDFLDFAKKVNMPIKEIYSMYRKLNGDIQSPPPSAGSVKTNNSDGQKYTQAKIDKMTPEQLAEVWDDPEFRKIAGL